MAYDEETAARFRDELDGLVGVTEKRMMGGVCFMLNGNMVGGADRNKEGICRLMFRVGVDNVDRAAGLPGGEPMEMGGRRMRGFFFVESETCSNSDLKKWISLSVEHAMSLPPK